MNNFDFAAYVRPLRKWWWLIAGCVLIAAVSSFIYERTLPEMYRAHSTIMVGAGAIKDPNPENTEFYLAQTLASIYVDLARRARVSGAVMAALSLDAIPNYSVAVVPNTQVIEISVLDTIPERAQAVAAELVKQLVLLSPAGDVEEQQQQFIKQQLEILQKSILDAQDEIERRNNDLATALSAREIQTIRADIAALEAKTNTLQANYTALVTRTEKGAANQITIIEAASVPTAPEPSNALITILLAAAIGTMLGVGTAYLLEFIDDSVSSAARVERLGLTTLAVVPLQVGDKDHRNDLVMVHDPHSAAAEAFRVLRTNLRFASVDQPLALIQVTSPLPREGKSATAANLAVAMAQVDMRVVLVDADLHRPSQHRRFQMVNNLGLTSALLGDPDMVETFLRPTVVPNLRLLTTGPLPPNPSELLGSRRMKAVLNKLGTIADLIVVDSPPLTVLSDAAALAKTMDGVLLVFRKGITRQNTAKRAVAALQQVQAHCLGVVLNGVPEGETRYHYNYDRDYAQPHYRRSAAVQAAQGKSLALPNAVHLEES